MNKWVEEYLFQLFAYFKFLKQSSSHLHVYNMYCSYNKTLVGELQNQIE